MVVNDYIILNDKLTEIEKGNFIKSVMDMNLELFISYLFGNKACEPYDISKEVSEPGNKSIILHYVKHYGNLDIIKFLFEYLIDLNLLDKALKLKTKDNNCPMLCLLKSDVLNIQQKKDIYFKIIKNYKISISNEVSNEANKRIIYDEKIIRNKALNTLNKRNIYNKIREDNNDNDIITN